MINTKTEIIIAVVSFIVGIIIAIVVFSLETSETKNTATPVHTVVKTKCFIRQVDDNLTIVHEMNCTAVSSGFVVKGE